MDSIVKLDLFAEMKKNRAFIVTLSNFYVRYDELMSIDMATLSTKVYLLFLWPIIGNAKVNFAYFSVVLGWVTHWEVFRGARE